MDNVAVSLLGGCIATIVPLLFLSVIVKDTKSRRILLYFCWGTLAGLLAYSANTLLADEPSQVARVTVTIVPIVEEVFKGFALLLFLFGRGKSRYIPVFIVYCAFASGVGFSIQESIFYFSQTQGSAADIITLTIRTLTTALMHGMSTSIVGMGLMLLQRQRHILLPAISGLFALATGIHALFNLLLPTNLAVVAMLMPLGLFLAGLAFLNGFRNEEEGKL